MFVVEHSEAKVVAKLKPQSTSFLQIYKAYESEVKKVTTLNRYGPEIFYEDAQLILEKYVEGKALSNEQLQD